MSDLTDRLREQAVNWLEATSEEPNYETTLLTEAADALDAQDKSLRGLSELANELVDAENQLHMIRHTKMAKNTMRDVEAKLRTLAGPDRRSDMVGGLPR